MIYIYINNILHDVSWGWTFPLLSLDVCCCHTFGPTLQTSLRGTGLCSKLRRRRCWKVDQSWIKVRHFESFWQKAVASRCEYQAISPTLLGGGELLRFHTCISWYLNGIATSDKFWVAFFWMWMMWCRSFRIGSFVLRLCLVSERVVVSKTCQASPASGHGAWTAGDNTHLHSAYWPIDSYIIPSP